MKALCLARVEQKTRTVFCVLSVGRSLRRGFFVFALKLFPATT